MTNPEALKNAPPHLVEEVKQLTIRTEAYLRDHAKLAAEYKAIKEQRARLAEKTRQYCPCEKCRAATRRSTDSKFGASVQNAVTLIALLVITGFVIGYVCGLGR